MTIKSRLSSLYDVHGEKLRFLIVGVWNTLASIVLFNIGLFLTKPLAQQLSTAGQPWRALGGNYYLIVFWAAWIVSVVQSTATMKYFAFRSSGAFWPQVRRSYVIYLPAQGISTGVLYAGVQLLHMPPPVAQLVAVFITTIFSYVGHKHFTFRSVEEETPQGTITQ